MEYNLSYTSVGNSSSQKYQMSASYGPAKTYNAANAAVLQESPFSIQLEEEKPKGRFVSRCSTFNAGGRCEICRRECQIPA
ncbi:hypothetical protein HZB00_03145 [Candidatus Woesearchaeota archaeon]|nr:hypothetical protein [Candidatus Woesearchaeota archaeon]